MKKTFFDFGLYKEGLRQLRTMGLVGILAFAGSAVVDPMTVIIENMNMQNSGSDEVYTSITNLLNSNGGMIMIYVVLVPLMVLSLFRFLNHREASDLYHSFPQTRMALFFSFFAALMTYVTITVVVSSLLNLGIMALFPRYFAVDIAASFHMIFNIWAASLLVAAAVALAMNLTGTTFSNVIVSGFILFLPRALIQIIIAWTAGTLPFVDTSRMPSLLDGKLNVVIGPVIAFFENSAASDVFTATASGIYTFCLAVLYLALAALAFQRRKSECAGYAAPNRTIQAIYRLTAAMVVCLLPCYGLYSGLYLYQGEGFYASDLFGIIVFYLIAVAVYFLYELLTTKRATELKRIVPGLGILVGMNVVLLLLCIGGNSMIKNKTFTAAEISAVSYLGTAENYYYDTAYEDYFDAMTENIRLDNEEICNIIAQQYTENSRLWNEERETFYEVTQQMDYVRVAIHSGSRTYYRKVYVTSEQMRTIVGELEAAEEFRAAYLELPELEEIILTMDQNYSFDQEETVAAVYEALREDVRDMTFEEWFAICAAEEYDENNVLLCTVYANIFVNNKSCQIELPVYPFMERAAEAYLEGERWDDQQQELIEVLKEENPYEEMYIQIEYYPEGSGGATLKSADLNYSIYDDDSVTLEKARTHAGELAAVLEEKAGEKPDFAADTAVIYMSRDIYDERNLWYGWETTEAYFNIPVEDLPEYFKAQLQDE